MADVGIGNVTWQTGNGRMTRAGPWFLPGQPLIGYCFGIALTTFAYSKTVDGGKTWAAPVTIGSSGTNTYIAGDSWADWATPGDTGTLIHCWYFDSTNDKVFWRSLDTATDTLGTERTAFTGASAVANRGSFCSGTKTRSGYLYVAFDIDAGAEHGIVRSTDNGTTWSANLATTFVETNNDECILFPATGTGDNNDCWAIYQDESATALTMKMWDSSAAAQVESSTVQTMTINTTDLTGQRGFAGSIRPSDGALILVSCSERDTATADMQCWVVTGVTAASLTGITAKTNITTNIDDNYNPAVFIDQTTDNIFVAYNGKIDGSEVLGTTTSVYYVRSVDGGTTWSAEHAYSEGAASVVQQVWVGAVGSRFSVVWRQQNTVFDNNWTNSIDLVTPIELVTEPLTPCRHR